MRERLIVVLLSLSCVGDFPATDHANQVATKINFLSSRLLPWYRDTCSAMYHLKGNQNVELKTPGETRWGLSCFANLGFKCFEKVLAYVQGPERVSEGAVVLSRKGEVVDRLESGREHH